MLGGWKYASASIIGTSHSSSSESVCQDANQCIYLQDSGVLICVASDGAGSALRSDEGSRIACEIVIREGSCASPDEVCKHAFALSTLVIIRAELLAKSQKDGARLKDFACTLLVAVIKNGSAAFWQIGDGAICFRFSGEDSFHFAFWPAKGEYANVTEFVTDENAIEELQFDDSSQSVVDLALFTDGLERLALDFALGEVHAPFLTPLFPYLRRGQPGHLEDISSQMRHFLGSERVNNHTDDDKTLILATLEADGD
jgi:hypothetical protein